MAAGERRPPDFGYQFAIEAAQLAISSAEASIAILSRLIEQQRSLGGDSSQAMVQLRAANERLRRLYQRRDHLVTENEMRQTRPSLSERTAEGSGRTR
jgi:multidrug resistance efflux pump